MTKKKETISKLTSHECLLREVIYEKLVTNYVYFVFDIITQQYVLCFNYNTNKRIKRVIADKDYLRNSVGVMLRFTESRKRKIIFTEITISDYKRNELGNI